MKVLECVNFSPRHEFEAYATREIERLLAMSPSDAEGRLRAFFDQDRFVLEASIVSSEGLFKASIGVPVPHQKHPRGRMWQVAALDELMESLERQVCKWRRRRFAA